MFLIGLQLYYKRDPGTGFSFEFRKIPKNTFFTEHIRWLLLYYKQQQQQKTLDLQLIRFAAGTEWTLNLSHYTDAYIIKKSSLI